VLPAAGPSRGTSADVGRPLGFAVIGAVCAIAGGGAEEGWELSIVVEVVSVAVFAGCSSCPQAAASISAMLDAIRGVVFMARGGAMRVPGGEGGIQRPCP
jgi:hypothetical protein